MIDAGVVRRNPERELIEVSEEQLWNLTDDERDELENMVKRGLPNDVQVLRNDGPWISFNDPALSVRIRPRVPVITTLEK